jgi:uncharacterized protein (TIGR02996 family)
MTELDDLLNALAERPHDDTLRQELARRLSERGDPRGEFILTQLALTTALDEVGRARAAADCARANDRISSLRQKSDALLAAHGKEWLGRLSGLIRNALWENGFPAFLSVDAKLFRDNAEELVRLAPTMTSLELVYDNDGPCPPQLIRDILNVPGLERVEHLYLRGRWGDEGAELLAASPRLKGLKTLFLADAGVGPRGAVALLGSDHLPQLEELNLSGNPIGGEGTLRMLALKQLPPSLRTLILDDAGIHDGAAALLAQSDILCSLQELSLQGNPLSVNGIRGLSEAPVLKDVVLWLDTDGLPQPTRLAVQESLLAREGRQRHTRPR